MRKRKGTAFHRLDSYDPTDVATDAEALGLGKHRIKGPGDKWKHRPEDLAPCTKCGLRGHVAGDPDRCLPDKVEIRGLGGAQWMTGGDVEQSAEKSGNVSARCAAAKKPSSPTLRELRPGVPSGRCRCDDCAAKRGAAPVRENDAQWARIVKENKLRNKAKRGDSWRE